MLVNISPGWPGKAVGEGGGRSTRPRLRAVPAGVRPERLTVRPARIPDMRQVQPLIQRFANDNVMLPKTFDQLARTFREFVVVVDEGDRILGCGALRVYNEELAEICSLAVDEPYQGMGIGRMLVEQLIENARELQIESVFALTLEPGFFDRLGFHVVPKEDFPLKVWADCRSCPKLHACDEIAVVRGVFVSAPDSGA